MSRGNNRQRKVVRSARKHHKKRGDFRDEETANSYLLRLAEREPLRALGMRAYQCERCEYFHVGRGAAKSTF